MSTLRRTSPALLLTALLLAAITPLTTVSAVPTEASEYYYGVEYDWTSLDSDLQNVTGLDIQELFSEIMEDADGAGFNLDLGQLTTGSSNVYVHQTEDISVQTIQDLDGNDVQVWSRTSDVVLRHGLLSNAVIMTDWSETTFGSEPTGFDVDIIAEAENVLTVDMLYTEYLNDQYQLVGADMDFDMMIGNDMNLGIDIMVEGGGEELNIDFDTGMDVSYSIASLAEWRLGAPSPIYIEAAANDNTDWECIDDPSDVGVYGEGGEVEVEDLCGMLDGTYIGSADYNVYLTGLPMEEFGFDEGQFDLSISDELTNEGDYEGEANMEDVNFNMRSSETLQVDLGDGTVIDATPCDTCPPGNPVMFIMMGNVITHASESFGEAVAEDFEAELEDSFAEIFENIFGGDDDNDDDDYYFDDDMFMCDSGETVYEWQVNNGDEDCSDGSDEMALYLRGGMSEDWESGDHYYSLNGQIDTTVLGFETSATIMCEYDGYYQELTIDNVNDGWDDCDDGSDEHDDSEPEPAMYACLDGSQTSFELVNDGTADCPDASDEPVDNEGDWFYCDGEHIPWQWLNDGVANCENGGDEYDPNNEETFYCDDYTTTISFELVRDGTVDCNDGSDEGEAIFFMMDAYITDEDGNALLAAQELMVCAMWGCDITENGDGGNAGVYYTSEVMAPSTYGLIEMCSGASISEADGTLIIEAVEMCNSASFGPSVWSSNLYLEGDNQLSVFAEAGHGEYDDVTMSWQLMDVTDGANTLVDSGFEEWADESTVSSEKIVDISGPGEYCLEVHLTQDGQTESFDEQRECVDVDEAQEVSDKLTTIGEALGESGLVDVLQAFGENLGATFEDVAENEVPVFPYEDGMWAPLWSDEQATIVGVGVYAWDEDENGYVIAGPTTTGYSQDLPMTFASIRYITGVPAQEAQQEMAEFDDLADIVDVENHDLGELEQVLEDAGADTSGLGFDDAANTGGDDTAEEVDEPETAEEVAEDSGLLPFVSPLTVIALIGLAAVAGNRRTENE
jgi:hypothetical protein